MAAQKRRLVAMDNKSNNVKTITYFFDEDEINDELEPCCLEWKKQSIFTKHLKLKKLGICMEKNDLLLTDKPLMSFENGEKTVSDCVYFAKQERQPSQIITKMVNFDKRLLRKALINTKWNNVCSYTFKYALFCIDSNGQKYHGQVKKCKLIVCPARRKLNLLNEENDVVNKQFTILQNEILLCTLQFQNPYPHQIVENTDFKIQLNVKTKNDDAESICFATASSDSIFEINDNRKEIIIKETLKPKQIIECNLVYNLKKIPGSHLDSYFVYFTLKKNTEESKINKNPIIINLQRDLKPVLRLKNKSEKVKFSIAKKKYRICNLTFQTSCPIDEAVKISINDPQNDKAIFYFYKGSSGDQNEMFDVINKQKTIIIQKQLTSDQSIECALYCEMEKVPIHNDNISLHFKLEVGNKSEIINEKPMIISFIKGKIPSVHLINKINKPIEKSFSIVSEKKEYHICSLEFKTTCNIAKGLKISIKDTRQEINNFFFSFKSGQKNSYDIINNGKSISINENLSAHETFNCDLIYKLEKLPSDFSHVYIYFYMEVDGHKENINQEPLIVTIKKITLSDFCLINDIRNPFVIQFNGVEQKKGFKKIESLKFKNNIAELTKNNGKLYISLNSKGDNDKIFYFLASNNKKFTKKKLIHKKNIQPKTYYSCDLFCNLKNILNDNQSRLLYNINFFIENESMENDPIQPGAMTISLEKEKTKLISMMNEVNVSNEIEYIAKKEGILLWELTFHISSEQLLHKNEDLFIDLIIDIKGEKLKKKHVINDPICFVNANPNIFKIDKNGKRITLPKDKVNAYDSEMILKCDLVYNAKSSPVETISYGISFEGGTNRRNIEYINKNERIFHITPNITNPKLVIDIKVNNKSIEKIEIDEKMPPKNNWIQLPDIKWRQGSILINEVFSLSMINLCKSGRANDNIILSNIVFEVNNEIDNRIINQQMKNRIKKSFDRIVLNNVQEVSHKCIVKEFLYLSIGSEEHRLYLKDYVFNEMITFESGGEKSGEYNLLLNIDRNKIQYFKDDYIDIPINVKITCEIKKRSQTFNILIKFRITKEKSLHWLAFDFGTSAIATMLFNGKTTVPIQLNPEIIGRTDQGTVYLESVNNYLYPTVYKLTDVDKLTTDRPYEAIMHIKTYNDFTSESNFVIPYLKTMFGFKEILFEIENKIITIENLVKSVLMNHFHKNEQSQNGQTYIDNILINKINEMGHLFENIIFSHPNNFTNRYKELFKEIIYNCFSEKKTVEFLSESDAVAFLYAYKKNIERQSKVYKDIDIIKEKVIVYDLGAGTLDLTYVEIQWKFDANDILQPLKISVLAQYCLPKAGNYLDYVIAKGIFELVSEKLLILGVRNKSIKEEKVKKHFDPDCDDSLIQNEVIDTKAFGNILQYKLFIEKNIKPILNKDQEKPLFARITKSRKINIYGEIFSLFNDKLDELDLDEKEKQDVFNHITLKNLCETKSMQRFVKEISTEAIDSIKFIAKGPDHLKKPLDVDNVIVSGRSVNCPLINSKLNEMFPKKIISINEIVKIDLSKDSINIDKEDYQKTAVARGLASYANLILNRKQGIHGYEQLSFIPKRINVRIGYIYLQKDEWVYKTIIEPYKNISEDTFDVGLTETGFDKIAWVTTFEKTLEKDKQKRSSIFSYVTLITNQFTIHDLYDANYDIPVKGKIEVTEDYAIRIKLKQNNKLSNHSLIDPEHIERDHSAFDYQNNWPFFSYFKPVQY